MKDRREFIELLLKSGLVAISIFVSSCVVSVPEEGYRGEEEVPVPEGGFEGEGEGEEEEEEDED